MILWYRKLARRPCLRGRARGKSHDYGWKGFADGASGNPEKRDEIATEMNQLAKTFIQDNYENVLGPGLFIMLGNSMPYPFMTPLMQEIIDAAPEAFKNNYMVKEYVSVARENMSHAPLH